MSTVQVGSAPHDSLKAVSLGSFSQEADKQNRTYILEIREGVGSLQMPGSSSQVTLTIISS